MKLYYNHGCITTDHIKIERGIFQGDLFSPLLLCLALVPLISEQATSGYGNIVINVDTEIQELDQEGVYKYLGVCESDGTQQSKK